MLHNTHTTPQYWPLNCAAQSLFAVVGLVRDVRGKSNGATGMFPTKIPPVCCRRRGSGNSRARDHVSEPFRGVGSFEMCQSHEACTVTVRVRWSLLPNRNYTANRWPRSTSLQHEEQSRQTFYPSTDGARSVERLELWCNAPSINLLRTPKGTNGRLT